MLYTNGIKWAFWSAALFLYLTGCAPKIVQVKTYSTTRNAVKELQKGTVEAVIGDFPVIAYEARESAGSLDVAGQQFDKQTLGIGVAKNSEELKAVVTNTLVQLIEDKTYINILMSWAVASGRVEPPVRPAVVPETAAVPELGDGALRVGMELSYPPMEFIDEFKNQAGVDVEIARAIGKALEVEVELVDMPFDALVDALETNKVDLVLSAMAITDERASHVDFIPYLEMGSGILVKKGNPNGITRVSDLCGHTVAAQEATSQVSGLESQQCE